MAAFEVQVLVMGLAAFSVYPCPSDGNLPGEPEMVTAIFPGGTVGTGHTLELFVETSDVKTANPPRQREEKGGGPDDVPLSVWKVGGALDFRVPKGNATESLKFKSPLQYFDLIPNLAKVVPGIDMKELKRSSADDATATLVLTKSTDSARDDVAVLSAETFTTCTWKFAKHSQQVAGMVRATVKRLDTLTLYYGPENEQSIEIVDGGGDARKADGKVVVYLANAPSQYDPNSKALQHFLGYYELARNKKDSADRKYVPKCSAALESKMELSPALRMLYNKLASCAICQACYP
jgi:hypothetical protein